MRTFLLCSLLVLPSAASAFSSRQVGLYVGAAGGGGVASPPLAGGLGWQGSIGVWRGTYDADYFLGRYLGGGITVRHLLTEQSRLSVDLELRRGLDLAIIGVHGFIAAGPEWTADRIGFSARVGGTIKYRPRPMFGPYLRGEVGIGYDGQKFGPRIAGNLGFEVAFPVAGRERDR